MQGNFLTICLQDFVSFLCWQVILERTWPTCVAKQHLVPSEAFRWNRWSTSVPSRYFIYICPEQVFCVHLPWVCILCTSFPSRHFVYICLEQVFCVHPPWAGILCTSSLSTYFVYILPEHVFCVHPPWARNFVYIHPKQVFHVHPPQADILCTSASSRYFVNPIDLGWGVDISHGKFVIS